MEANSRRHTKTTKKKSFTFLNQSLNLDPRSLSPVIRIGVSK